MGLVISGGESNVTGGFVSSVEYNKGSGWSSLPNLPVANAGHCMTGTGNQT